LNRESRKLWFSILLQYGFMETKIPGGATSPLGNTAHSTSSALGSRPLYFDLLCNRCRDIKLFVLKRQNQSHSHENLVIDGLVIDGSDQVLDEGISRRCRLCKMVRDYRDTSTSYEALGESPHLTAIFQSRNQRITWTDNRNIFGHVRVVSLENCIQGFASGTGDFVLSVKEGRDDLVLHYIESRANC
jgi:hypothetical protein